MCSHCSTHEIHWNWSQPNQNFKSSKWFPLRIVMQPSDSCCTNPSWNSNWLRSSAFYSVDFESKLTFNWRLRDFVIPELANRAAQHDRWQFLLLVLQLLDFVCIDTSTFRSSLIIISIKVLETQTTDSVIFGDDFLNWYEFEVSKLLWSRPDKHRLHTNRRRQHSPRYFRYILHAWDGHCNQYHHSPR